MRQKTRQKKASHTSTDVKTIDALPIEDSPEMREYSAFLEQRGKEAKEYMNKRGKELWGDKYQPR